MELVILIAVMAVLGAFTIKCMKNEDSLIELEDKIISDIRDFIRAEKKGTKNARELTLTRSESAGSRAA